MRILLDTRCWLWMESAPERLGPGAVRLVEDPGNDLLLSAASAWEIAIKHALGKLRLPLPPHRYVPSRLTRSGVVALPIQVEHALHAGRLPPHHRDPFDRMLVAQAQVERLTILTADPALEACDVPLIRV